MGNAGGSCFVLFLHDLPWPPLVSCKVAPRDVSSLPIPDAVDVTLTRDKISADRIEFDVGPTLGYLGSLGAFP